MSDKEDRRLSCEDGPPMSPCSSDRSTPVSIEVDSPGPSRSPSPRRGDEYSRGGDGYPRRSEAYSALYRRPPSPHQSDGDQRHTEGHSSAAYHEQSRARTPPPSSHARTSSTNPAPKLSFGISRILSDDEPISKSKSSDNSASLRNDSSPTSSNIKPTDLRVHSVLLPHPMHRGLSVVVPHPHHSHTTNGHLSPAGGDGPPPPPAHHHPPSVTGGFFPPHSGLPSSHAASLAALDLQSISTMSITSTGGVIRVPAHRPMNLPPGVGMSPMMFPWMQDRKDRLTGGYHFITTSII